MKRIAALAVVLTIAGVALYFAQRGKRQDVVSPDALVNAAADVQRDLTRAPMHFTRIPDSEETRIGDELAQQYVSAAPLQTAEARAMESYVSAVGRNVAAHAKRRLNFRFHLVPNPDLINAFALPGGHVFVGQGLLDQMRSEDELAFVLGHEIEHIDHYHAVERVQVEAQLKHLDLDIVAGLAQIPMSLWQVGYTKDEEFEADREGIRIASAAGYSAQGAVNLLNRWTKLHREYVIHAETPTDELSRIAVEGLEGYFRTHPLPAERLAQANRVIAEDHLAVNQPLKPFHVEYEVTSQEQ
ncbi:MAG TPA: M48 family metalloprotease [Terracidiphilus sp.]|nr:M48 family metalloprotease [Terracidiphilus sp.]